MDCLRSEPIDTPLADLVEDFDTIAAGAVPYARLPRRFSDYADEFVRWADLADQTRHTLQQRPRLGDAAIDALIEAAHEAVQAHQRAAAAGPLSPEAAVTALLDRFNDFDRALLDGRR